MPYAAGVELDIRALNALSQLGHSWPTPTTIVTDSTYPEITTSIALPWQYWRMLYEYQMWNRLPPGTRVICGYAIPSVSENRAVACTAADLIDLSYTDSMSALDIANAIEQAWTPST